MSNTFDFLIAGSGFGGCLLALILDKLGHRVILVDRASHPRFAIGESSTPLADATLRELCKRYNLPNILPLTSYGTATKLLPHVTVGCKRGFTYFKHHPGQRFCPLQGRLEQLIVAASATDDDSDTHWLRSEVDQHFANEVRATSIALLEDTSILAIGKKNRGWTVTVETEAQPRFELNAKFLIDASGRSGVIGRLVSPGERQLNNKPGSGTNRFLTNSRAIYGHFIGVKRWADLLTDHGIETTQHPFPCDQAAVHHLLSNGWMWQLPFDSGVTSVGICLHRPAYESIEHLSAIDQFDQIVASYPSLADQFDAANLVAPSSGLQVTQRLQFCSKAGGRGWVALPTSAGFIDPLHSTGIAHTLHAIRSLAIIFSDDGTAVDKLLQPLEQYATDLAAEFSLIDKLVAGCYLTVGCFEAFVAATMLYFAAVTFAEKNTSWNVAYKRQPAFLNADNVAFCACVDQAWHSLLAWQAKAISTEDLTYRIEELIQPFNQVGLFHPKFKNIYLHTAGLTG